MNEEFIREIIKSTINGEPHLGTNLKEQCLKYFYDLISENQQLKEKLEQRDNIINKLIEIKYNFQNENSLFIFENDVLLKFMNDLQYIFNSKIRSDK